ncbi:MAG TPA: ABC transporter permease subunit [Gemmataceae bacterium]|jgi:ABC-type transport system involved in multi-copper enzyme maturation permease subunit|nr:ABC transporter permease subunit [Gemmataceae bacterium]
MAVFFYDLLRSTRKGRVVLLRTAYALVLLLAMYNLHRRWFDEGVLPGVRELGPGTELASRVSDPTGKAKFAEEFTRQFLLIQMVAVLILTPVYTASAVAEERERGTLDSLLTTYLTPRQFVISKLASRVVQMWGVLLAGLPILALVPLWGGVSPGMIFGWFGLTAVTVLSLGALGICCSARISTPRAAIAATYAIAAGGSSCPLVFFGSPFWLIWSLVNDRMIVGDMLGIVLPMAAVLHIFLAVMLIDFAARTLVPRAQTISLPATRPEPPVDSPLPPQPWPLSELDFSLPPVGERALLWKELHFGGNNVVRYLMALVRVFFLVLGALGLAMFVLSVVFSGGPVFQQQLNDIVRVVAVGTLLTALVGTVLQATASVGRERQRQTLDILMTLPNGRDEVLRMKWLASFMCGRWLLPVLLGVLVLGMLGGGVHPAAVPLFVIAAGVHVGFAASLGVLLSVTVPSTDRAGFLAVLVLFLSFVVPLVFCPAGVGFMPPVAWLFLLPRSSLTNSDSTILAGAGSPIFPLAVLLGLVTYACLSGVLWLLAVRRFHREADRAAIA